jgi:outer membrane autotransporter protein
VNSELDYTFTGGAITANTLDKSGNGTLTLANANTYRGGTTVSAGTLNLTENLASAVAVTNASGTLTLSAAAQSVRLANGATLNAHAGGSIVGNLDAAGALLNFYLPATFAANDTLLDVGGHADIAASTVRAGILGDSSPLVAGDTLILVNAASLSGFPTNDLANGIGLQGVSLQYDFTLTTDANRLLATVKGEDDDGQPGNGGNDGAHLNKRTKALSEGFLAGTAFLNQGADFVAERGLLAALETDGSSTLNGFAAIGSGRLKHRTGSHIDVDGYTLVAGLALTGIANARTFTLGAFIEHGEGDYDTANSFANAASVHGKGDADYTGGGLLAHLTFNETERGHFYTEASARLGKVELDFNTRDLIDVFGRRAAYDSTARYVSAHAGLGYLGKLSESSRLKLYGQVLWSRQGADTVRLTTGEPVKFQAVDSQRIRLGARWNYAVSQNSQLTLGAAWEHEFDGEAKASIHGYRLDTPKLSGNTASIETGFTLNPGKPLSVDVGLQGYAGRREGGAGSFRVNYKF